MKKIGVLWWQHVQITPWASSKDLTPFYCSILLCMLSLLDKGWSCGRWRPLAQNDMQGHWGRFGILLCTCVDLGAAVHFSAFFYWPPEMMAWDGKSVNRACAVHFSSKGKKKSWLVYSFLTSVVGRSVPNFGKRRITWEEYYSMF